jgi:hypothetical protein
MSFTVLTNLNRLKKLKNNLYQGISIFETLPHIPLSLPYSTLYVLCQEDQRSQIFFADVQTFLVADFDLAVQHH